MSGSDIQTTPLELPGRFDKTAALVGGFDPARGQFFNWDYPSIGVDSLGRIVIGAVANPATDNRLFTIVSTNNGASFSAPDFSPHRRTPSRTSGLDREAKTEVHHGKASCSCWAIPRSDEQRRRSGECASDRGASIRNYIHSAFGTDRGHCEEVYRYHALHMVSKERAPSL
jgi:hypothetical protein